MINFIMVYNCFETIKVKKECYLMRQNNTIYTFWIKLSFSTIRQDKSKLQKQIIKYLSKLQRQLDTNSDNCIYPVIVFVEK